MTPEQGAKLICIDSCGVRLKVGAVYTLQGLSMYGNYIIKETCGGWWPSRFIVMEKLTQLEKVIYGIL